jgi:hypothetical protein
VQAVVAVTVFVLDDYELLDSRGAQVCPVRRPVSAGEKGNVTADYGVG